MQQERPERQQPAAPRGACDLGDHAPQVFDLALAQLAKRVRSGKHAHGAVVGRAVVEVHPNRDHAGQDLRRRLHMDDAVLQRRRFDRGGAEPRLVVAGCDGDRHILMPRHLPVRVESLVKQNGAGHETPRAKEGLGDVTDRSAPSKCAGSGGVVEEVPDPRPRLDAAELGTELVEELGRDNRACRGLAVRRERRNRGVEGQLWRGES